MSAETTTPAPEAMDLPALEAMNSPAEAASSPAASPEELCALPPIPAWRYPRVAWRLFASAIFLFCWSIVWLPILQTLKALSPRWRRRLGMTALRNSALGLSASWGIRTEVRGPMPPRPSMLVCNHLSYVDMLSVGSVAKMHFVGQSGIAKWPVIGWLAVAVGTIFLKRFELSALKATNELLEQHYQEDLPTLVFLEGTTTSGDRILKFNGALLSSAIKKGVPVVPVAVHYRTPKDDLPLSKTVPWWGTTGFNDHLLHLLSLRRVVAVVALGEPISTEGANRKDLAKQLRRAVSTLYAEISGVGPAEELERLGDTPLFFPTE
jgi:1-acyl-sn-glycerol-3-phosphate acyltransferase